jgi:pimeloyl-ACP methyl ester carboxylesterase
MLDGETFFVSGKIGHASGVNAEAIAIVAVSDRYTRSEVVDVNHAVRMDSYYSLYLPAGDYRLLVLSDLDGNGYYNQAEVIGGRSVALTKDAFPDRVLGRYDIDMGTRVEPVKGRLKVKVSRSGGDRQSVFYPNGTLRALDDPIFSPRMASLGMYEPAAFLEAAPLMFYALEEDHFYKIPVVFVHGIGGSIRVFDDVLAMLDKTRYRPWFFYYPSGADLNQLSTLFYTLFLSGKVLQLEDMPLVIVAHSMGGLVAREALNLRTGGASENKVKRLVTVASPLGGVASAQMSEKAPVVIPAWRDISPDSQFIRRLHRRSLPEDARYHLIFAYGDDRGIKLGGNSDGVVALASQLSMQAQREAAVQRGFDDTHMGVLENPAAVGEVIRIIAEVDSPYPETHMREFAKGGYKVKLAEHYTPLEAFYIHNMGYFLEALASGRLDPVLPAQEHFVRSVRGEISPQSAMETGWIKFIREYPDQSLPVQSANDATNRD